MVPQEIRWATGDASDDGWVYFNVRHSGGAHVLQMQYEPNNEPYYRPLSLKIGDFETWWSVGCHYDHRPSEIDEYGPFSLGESAGEVKVGFRRRRNSGINSDWPVIRCFQFVEGGGANTLHSPFSETLKSDTNSIINSSTAPPLEPPKTNPPKTNPFTFTFEIGLPCHEDEDTECIDVCLKGRYMKFVFGEAHDSIIIDGKQTGYRFGGDNYPGLIHFDEDDVISGMTLGLSHFHGGGVFNGLVLCSTTTQKRKIRTVGAKFLLEPWTYDREKLGLNLWITSIYAPKNGMISRYGFTFSCDENLKFNEEEFDTFWSWLESLKQLESWQKGDFQSNQVPKDTLSKSFKEVCTHSGYLHRTNENVSITYDAFSIFVHRLPDGKTFRFNIFVNGVQYDYQKNKDTEGSGGLIDDIQSRRNDMLAFAISVALDNTHLLEQMGLIRQQQQPREGDRYYINLQHEQVKMEFPKLESGKEPEMARQALTILAMGGLRFIFKDVCCRDKGHGWNIYSVASASDVFDRNKRVYLTLGAFVCALIQIVLPIMIIYRNIFVAEREVITWEAYASRIFFGWYAIFFTYMTWEADNEERIIGWLCLLPEFNKRSLILGMVVNKLSKIIVSLTIIALLLRSYEVSDVALNALALYFILDVDNVVVNDSVLKHVFSYQEEKFNEIISKVAVDYRFNQLKNISLPDIWVLPTWFTKVTSYQVTLVCMSLLCIGCVLIMIEPWVLGSWCV